MSLETLRQNDMMAHLLDSLDAGKDIGHYGRLVFVMVGRHFFSDDELVEQMMQDKDCDETKARSLLEQVASHDYSPPRPEKIMEYQNQQDFPICPNGDPDACNVYKTLKFPDRVYEHIGGYHEQKAEAQR